MYNYYITNYKVNSLEIITKLKEERNLKLRKQFLEDKFAKKRYESPNSNNSKSKLEIIKELLDNGIVNNLIQFIEYSNDNVFIVRKYINMVIIQ